MDKTIRVGEIYTEEEYDGGVFLWSPTDCLAWLSSGEKTTKELIETDRDSSFVPNILNRKLTAREAISLHKAAVELGMNEHEDVTYWVRDYIVEKIREAQAIS